MYPTISRYIETLSEPEGFFRSIAPECERNIYGEVKSMAGGNAVVFKVRIGGEPYALKCYTKHRNSARTVYEFLPRLGSGLLYEARYLPQEIYISGPSGGGWHDVALTRWADGHTLEFALRKGLRSGDCAMLTSLAENFDAMAAELLGAEWAHGDLKPENVIVSPEGRMRLIDYDAMFVPPLEGRSAEEQGTPLYQHPRRGIRPFDRHIDDYPIALISATLHTLALEPRLHALHGNSDYFLFAPADILDGRSEGYCAALDTASRHGEGLLYGLLRSLASPVPRIEGLKEIIDALNRNTPAEASTLFVREGRWGYLSEDGSMAIPPVFDSALEFREDTAAVSIGGRNHFIDRTGRPTIDCSEFDSIKSFSNGLAAVRRDGVWYYIDAAGQLKDEHN